MGMGEVDVVAESLGRSRAIDISGGHPFCNGLEGPFAAVRFHTAGNDLRPFRVLHIRGSVPIQITSRNVKVLLHFS